MSLNTNMYSQQCYVTTWDPTVCVTLLVDSILRIFDPFPLRFDTGPNWWYFTKTFLCETPCIVIREFQFSSRLLKDVFTLYKIDGFSWSDYISHLASISTVSPSQYGNLIHWGNPCVILLKTKTNPIFSIVIC